MLRREFPRTRRPYSRTASTTSPLRELAWSSAVELARPTRIDELRSMKATHGAQLFDKAPIISRLTYRYDSSWRRNYLSSFDADASRSVALR